MSRQPSDVQTTRQWATGLTVTAVTMVSLFAFAKVSVFAVVAASGAVVVAGLISSLVIDKRLRSRRRR